MKKFPRSCLEVSRPLPVVRFERHTWEEGNLIWSVISPRAQLTQGQQTQQQQAGEHHFINNNKKTTLQNAIIQQEKEEASQLPGAVRPAPRVQA